MTAALLAGVFATSVLGSVHCVAMCGPLVGLQGGARSLRFAGLHSLGRLATYVTIGALAGFAGSALDLAGRLGNIQRLATLAAGATIVGWGVYALVRATRARTATAPAPARKQTSTAFGSALVHIRTRSRARRMFALGLITGLLPCGWLWAFAISAAGTGAAPSGALLMAAFWLGTVPAMVGVLGLAGPLVARLRARMPVVTAVALIAVGLATLGLRWHDAGTGQITMPHCHCHGATS
ncbi:MAG TPA: sulfite exporter TauE/SafE family protein [Kofleriaceae bacterium]|nr:sulfite exporter TauE/SafE family protein [Kofleriaceae bacterium]